MLRDDHVLAEISGDPALTHGQRLPGELGRALDAAGIPLDAIDLLSVVAGPGSFTGLRVGIAAMQGLAFSRGLGIVPVSTFDAIARTADAIVSADALRTHDGAQPSPKRPERAWLLAPWIDAQRGEVFATLLDADARHQVVAPSSATPLDTLSRWRQAMGERPVFFAGDGALRYRDVIAATLGGQAHIADRAAPLAGAAGRIAAEQPDRAVLPHGVVPVYVRRPDAELARERVAREAPHREGPAAPQEPRR